MKFKLIINLDDKVNMGLTKNIIINNLEADSDS